MHASLRNHSYENKSGNCIEIHESRSVLGLVWIVALETDRIWVSARLLKHEVDVLVACAESLAWLGAAVPVVSSISVLATHDDSKAVILVDAEAMVDVGDKAGAIVIAHVFLLQSIRAIAVPCSFHRTAIVFGATVFKSYGGIMHQLGCSRQHLLKHS